MPGPVREQMEQEIAELALTERASAPMMSRPMQTVVERTTLAEVPEMESATVMMRPGFRTRAEATLDSTSIVAPSGRPA